jgi:hypothetical protein
MVDRLVAELRLAPVAAVIVQHQFHGVALAVVRRRDVREEEQFHFDLRFTDYDLRSAQVHQS